MSALRDFLYLDTGKLYSFISQIHGGIADEIRETIRQQGGFSAGVEIGIPPFGAKLGGTKDSASEQQQTKRLTDPAYFSALHQYLRTESQIKDITGSGLELRQELLEGEFVEIGGTAEPPAVDYWIARVRELVDFLDRNLRLLTQTQDKGRRRTTQSLSRQQMNLFKDMVAFLEDYIKISRKEPGKQFIRVGPEVQGYGVWCGLIPDFIKVPLQASLPAKVRVVGRVERLLAQGQVFKIVDFSQFSQTTDVGGLLAALNALGPVIGQKAISEKDLQAQYPDIFVAPIAIYR